MAVITAATLFKKSNHEKIFLTIVVLLSLGIVFSSCSDNNNNNVNAGQLAKDEMYTCEMHNEVMSDHPGECPKCGMKLVTQKMTAEQQKMMNEGTYTKPKE